MAVNISITGLTTQQQQDVANAFDSIGGRLTAGPPDVDNPQGTPVSKVRWVELLLIRHIKNVVKGWKRGTSESALAPQIAQVDTDYPEA